MRWVIAGLALALVAGLAGAWLAGGDRIVAAWALDGQRETQGAMAGALRRLRAGDTAAVGALVAVCFGYGFFHAAGPGHGKLLIGGYGAARQVGALRLSAVALAASVAQGASAIALVGAGLWLLGLGRDRMTDLADRLLAPLSFAAIGCVGLWLVLRGARDLWQLRGAEAAEASRARSHDHDHIHDHIHDRAHADDHDHGGPHGHDQAHSPAGDAGRTCATCGHAHVPDPAALARATGPREVAMLIAAVAIRPCTGALFVLILTAQLQVFWAGILGTLAMALGTASVTIVVAVAAVSLRRGVLAGLADSPSLARAQPVLELAVGALVAGLAVPLVLASA